MLWFSLELGGTCLLVSQITIDGEAEDIDARYYLQDSLLVKRASSLFYLVMAPGFRVLFDQHGRVYIRLDPHFRYVGTGCSVDVK